MILDDGGSPSAGKGDCTPAGATEDGQSGKAWLPGRETAILGQVVRLLKNGSPVTSDHAACSVFSHEASTVAEIVFKCTENDDVEKVRDGIDVNLSLLA
jgi:hypothetical protein